jgi:hypothetical protein
LGAWGPGLFDNDDAMDLIDALAEEGTPELLTTALEEVAASTSENMLSPLFDKALAAADLIAASRGQGRPDLPEEAPSWITDGRHEFDDRAVALARQAVQRAIEEQSRLAGRWFDPDIAARWIEHVNNLARRLERL